MSSSAIETPVRKVPGVIRQFSSATPAIADAFEESVNVAKRVGKRGSDAVEELMDDTSERIKRHPIESIVTIFAIGFLAGGFISWLIHRK